MKSFSLELLPEETLYSYVVRSWLLSGEPSTRSFLYEFLGSAHRQLFSTFPSFIPRIVIESGQSPEEIINDHTLFPYHALFLPATLAEQAKAELICGQSSALHSHLSLVANRLPLSRCQFYCPECHAEDLRSYGIAYWHISHQLPFVRVCPNHLVNLCACEVTRRTLCLPPQNLPRKQKNFTANETSILFAKMSLEIFDADLTSLSQKRITECYIIGLQQHGLLTQTGSIRQYNWALLNERFWGNGLPAELLTSLLNERSEMNFPRCMVYQPKANHHAVKHILVIGQLFGSFSGFLSCYNDRALKLEINNEAAEHTIRVSDVKVSKLLKALRNGESLRQSAKAAKVSIGFAKSIAIQNGIEIERRAQRLFAAERKQILEMLKEGLKTQQIAKVMECSVGAVEQLLTQFPTVKKLREKLRYYQKRFRHRQAIVLHLRKRPSATRGEIQKQLRASYYWCYKHDKKWLYQNLPSEIPRNERCNRSEHD